MPVQVPVEHWGKEHRDGKGREGEGEGEGEGGRKGRQNSRRERERKSLARWSVRRDEGRDGGRRESVRILVSVFRKMSQEMGTAISRKTSQLIY